MATDLDTVLPRWHHHECHQVAVGAPSAVVLRAAQDLTWAEVPMFRALMSLRFLRSDISAQESTVLEVMIEDGFDVLDRSDDHLVFGQVLRTVGASKGRVPVDGAAGFAAFDQPGHVKIAFDFRVAGPALTTETRVFATDPRSRRRFTAYWLLIRPFSGLIRHEWLRGIRRRAQR